MDAKAAPPAHRGLDPAEAARRLAAHGPNLLPGNAPRGMLAIIGGVLTEPMFLMLLVAGGLYLALGDRAEAAFLLSFVFVVIGITLAQERKTQRALESLRELSAPRALVIRGGEETRVSGREVVVGDLLVLHEGDRIAADALLLDGHLDVDERCSPARPCPSPSSPVKTRASCSPAPWRPRASASPRSAPSPAPPRWAASGRRWPRRSSRCRACSAPRAG
ncbi:hypothetical protein GCM10009126_24390 [Rhodanobacter caeni]|uniref:Cation-transporting P-type ATPase N-terminal domain-containing protein n=1 Tax=Rhodanobacter caeni TaxID=657654 RepID=A0ABN0UQG0_9GAMM